MARGYRRIRQPFDATMYAIYRDRIRLDFEEKLERIDPRAPTRQRVAAVQHLCAELKDRLRDAIDAESVARIGYATSIATEAMR